MKGVVSLAVSRIGLFVLVLAFTVGGALSLDAAVTLGQGGSSKAPFDVGGAVAYKVSIDNDMGSSMRYTVTLTVGPDIYDYSISDSYTNNVNVNARSSGSTVFNVNFRTPKLNTGEFGLWANDKTETSRWERAWYRVDITPLVGDTMVVENYEGTPTLFKAFFEFGDPGVSPKQGTNTDLYSYEVTVFGSYRDNISLQVRPTSRDRWIDLGMEEYTTPGLSQTLRWTNQTLDFDFTAAQYRFKGTRESKVLEGPFWPVTVEYNNSAVTPERGLAGTSFLYMLDVKANKAVEVGLNVMDIGSKTFKPAGRVSYENVSMWQTLKWPNVQPGDISGSEGRSSYYFSFYYVGSEMPFLTTYDDSGQYYPGPDIVLVEFENIAVTPDNGSALTPYTYSVDLHTALPLCDVELQTIAPGSTIWRSQGVATYDGSDGTLTWRDVVLDGDSDGYGKYRFICGDSFSGLYKGPRIGAMDIVGFVNPYNASLYFTGALEGDISRVYTVTYTAKVNQPEAEPAEIEVDIYDPVARSWLPAGTKTSSPEKTDLNYTVNLAKLGFAGPFLGELKYRFVTRDRVLGEFPGPYIDVNFRNESAVEVPGSKITYRTEVLSSRANVPIALAYTTDYNNWYLSDTRPYRSSSQGWVTLEWVEYPRYYAFEFEALR